MLSKIRNWEVKDNWTSSDHRAITFEVHSDVTSSDDDADNHRFSLRKANWELVNQTITQKWSRFDQTPILENETGINNFASFITKELVEACTESIPRKGRVRHKRGWWTDELTTLKKKVAKLRKKFQSESEPTLRERKKDLYKNERNRYFLRLEQTRQLSFEKYVTEHGNKDPWGMVYKYQSKKLKTRQIISSVKFGGGETLSWKETGAVLLNTLLPDDKHDDDNNYHKNIRAEMTQSPDTSDDEIFGPDEVEKVVMSLKKGKAPGTDNIEVEIIQKTWINIKESIIHLLNSCLKHGTFPNIWKVGQVIILKKGGNRPDTDPKSYRPIMLLPVLGKVFEKLLVYRVMVKVNTSALFSQKQYGFREGRSTEDAIVDLVTSVKSSEEKYVLGIFLDISGAFDNLWWPSVMQGLKNFNCPSNIYKVLASYFVNKKAMIKDKFDVIEKTI